MDIKKIILSIIVFHYGILLCADIAEAPRLLHVFFKRLTETSVRGPHLAMTTPRITTDFGVCTIADDTITVTVDGEQEVWRVPGGPWTIHYYRDTDILTLAPVEGSCPIDEHHAQAVCPMIPFSAPEPVKYIASVQAEAAQPDDVEAKIACYAAHYIRSNIDQLDENSLYKFLSHVREMANHYKVEWMQLMKLIHAEIDPYLQNMQRARDAQDLKVGCGTCALATVGVVATYLVYQYELKKYNSYYEGIKARGERYYYELQDPFAASFIVGGLTAALWGIAMYALYEYAKPETTARFHRIQRIRDLLAV